MKNNLKNNRQKKDILIMLILAFGFIILIFYHPLKKIDFLNSKDESVKLKISNNDEIEESFYTNLEVIESISIPVFISEINHRTYSEKFKKKDVIIQSLKMENLNFKYVEGKLRFKEELNIMTNSSLYSDYFEVTINSEDGQELFSKKYNFLEIKSNNIIIDLVNLKNIKWKSFSLKLKCYNTNDKYRAEVALGNLSSYTIYTKYNNKKLANSLKFTANGRIKNYDYMWIGYVLFSILSIFLIRKGRNNNFIKNIERMYNKIKIKRIYNVLYFNICLISCISLFKIIVNTEYYAKISYSYLAIFIISLFLVVYNLFNDFKNRVKLEKMFLSIAIPIGLLYLIFVIPNWVSDEDAHFYKAFSVSTGIFKPVNDNIIPNVMIKNTKEIVYNYQKLSIQLEEETNYDNTSKVHGLANSYNSILYFPAAFGLHISKLLNLNIFAGYYVARMINFIIYLIFGYFSIKLIPFGKIIVIIFLLNPMLVHQAISLSVDSLVNSTCIYFISYILYLKYARDKICSKEFIILFLLMIGISITKYVYTPLVLLSLILISRKNNFFQKNVNWKIILGIILSFSITITMFIYINRSLTSSSVTNISVAEVGYSSEFINLIKNPLDYINIIYNTVVNNFHFYVESFIGTQLGWFTINTNRTISYLYLFLLILSPFFTTEKNKLKIKDKIIMIFILVLVTNLVFLAFYLSYVPYSQITIHGIQGRYFIPVMLLLPVIFINNNRYLNIKDVEKRVLILILLINLCSISSVITSFL